MTFIQSGVIEFRRIVYLDVNRTGSTQVIKVLRKLSATPEVRIMRHKPISKAGWIIRPPGRLVFTTVRNPWDWYVSLWAHGCDGHSAILRAFRQKLTKSEIAALYDRESPAESFRLWMALIHDPEFVDAHLPEYYPVSGLSSIAGLYTYRFLWNTTFFPTLFLRRFWIRSPESLSALYKRNKAPQLVLRTETLTADLIELVRNHQNSCGFIPDAATVVLTATISQANASKRTLPHYRDYYNEQTRQLVGKRDRFIIEEFDYQF